MNGITTTAMHGGKRRQLRSSGNRPLQAVTLIEFLVVIAVIAILAALLFPVWRTVEQRAGVTRSINNLRSLGAGLAMFAAENNNRLMPRAVYAAPGTPQPSSKEKYWTATLYNKGYIKDKSVFYDSRFPPYKDAGAKYPLENSIAQTYGMRDWVKPGDIFHNSTIGTFKALASVEKPASFFILAESVWINFLTPPSQGYGIAPGANGLSTMRIRIDPRTGKAGTLFLDGHAEQMPRDYFEKLHEDPAQATYSAGQQFYTWTGRGK